MIPHPHYRKQQSTWPWKIARNQTPPGKVGIPQTLRSNLLSTYAPPLFHFRGNNFLKLSWECQKYLIAKLFSSYLNQASKSVDYASNSIPAWKVCGYCPVVYWILSGYILNFFIFLTLWKIQHITGTLMTITTIGKRLSEQV